MKKIKKFRPTDFEKQENKKEQFKKRRKSRPNLKSKWGQGEKWSKSNFRNLIDEEE